MSNNKEADEDVIPSTAQDVRKAFIDYFVKLSHSSWPSSPVVPRDDHTLLFTNAGMNQFKPIFLGDVPDRHPFSTLRRAVNSQKCIRAGGKHNDLEDVGRDVYHHTFFEMLGSWSFGDYFKTEAISWAWDLLVTRWKLDVNRLYVTYFGGDDRFPDVPSDEETKNLWLKFLPPEKVLPFGAKDNFWEMGDTGPCGPCSEIHFDKIGGGRDARHLVNADDPEVLEVWNLVFMEFNREADGKMTRLPAKSVDTGMGLERILSVLQSKDSNYDTDLFIPIFEELKASSLPAHVPSYGGAVGEKDLDLVDMSYRVVADHIRTLCVAIADGADPSNEGRGYVLRRILRRALRFGRQHLGASTENLWLSSLAPVVVQMLGDAFPELRKKEQHILKVLQDEERQFAKTLDRGVNLFKKCVGKLGPNCSCFPGETAFVLHATYGFPLDLTEVMAREKSMTVDVEKFHLALEEHHRVSENRSFKTTLALAFTPEELKHLDDIKAPTTNDELKYSWNASRGIGEDVTTKIVAIWDGNHFQESLKTAGVHAALVTAESPFYSEAGGQIGDVGFFSTGKDDALTAHVIDTKKIGKFVFHVFEIREEDSTGGASVQVGAEVTLKVDFDRRAKSAKNHTATHLMNFALREILQSSDQSIDQMGSLVDPSKLRFDFSFDRALTPKEVESVESRVREFASTKTSVYTKEVALERALKVPGLRSLVGEVYPDPVRVVAVGRDIDDLTSEATSETDPTISVEFCGGTHLQNTEDLLDFVLISEESVSKGVRRITALTGDIAVDARRFGDEFESKVIAASKITSFEELETAQLSLSKEMNEKRDRLPYSTRRRCMDLLSAMQRRKLEEGKAKTKQLVKMGEEMGRTRAAHADPEVPTEVFRVDALREWKALESFAQAFVKGAPQKPLLLICYDCLGSTVMVLAQVPKCLIPKMSAKAWVAHVLPKDSRSGGTELTARGSSAVAKETVESLMSRAAEFAN